MRNSRNTKLHMFVIWHLSALHNTKYMRRHKYVKMNMTEDFPKVLNLMKPLVRTNQLCNQDVEEKKHLSISTTHKIWTTYHIKYICFIIQNHTFIFIITPNIVRDLFHRAVFHHNFISTKWHNKFSKYCQFSTLALFSHVWCYTQPIITSLVIANDWYPKTFWRPDSTSRQWQGHKRQSEICDWGKKWSFPWQTNHTSICLWKSCDNLIWMDGEEFEPLSTRTPLYYHLNAVNEHSGSQPGTN